MYIRFFVKKYCFCIQKQTFLVLFILFLFKPIYSQSNDSYLGYYALENEAVYLKHKKDNKKALNAYIKAFSIYRGFGDDYTRAINLSLELKYYKITYKLLKHKMLKTGWFSDELFVPQFADFIKTSFGNKYLKNRDKWEQINQKSIDPISYGLYKQINATDQLIRDGSIYEYLKPVKNDSLIKIVEMKFFEGIDNINYSTFIKSIKNDGFPGLNKLGGKELFDVFIIHIFKYNRNGIFETDYDKNKFLFLDSELRIQVLNGNFSNYTFAYCYDYSLAKDSVSYFGIPNLKFVNKQKIFYYFPIEDIENVDKRRKEIGLMPLWKQNEIFNIPLPPNYKRENE